MEKKAKKKWGKWVLLAFVLYCVIGGAMEAFSGSVSSAEDGKRVLEEIFPPEDGYEIMSDGKVDDWEAPYDEAEVGEPCEDYARKGDKIEVYDYTVWLGESGYASCYVSEEGKVIGFRTLVSESDPLCTYRLR